MSLPIVRLDRPVEAIISPVTPYASIEPGNFKHSGMSNEASRCPLISTLDSRGPHKLILVLAYISSVNVLDYATVVIPVTFADKNVDVVDPNFKPFSNEDAANMKTCKLHRSLFL